MKLSSQIQNAKLACKSRNADHLAKIFVELEDGRFCKFAMRKYTKIEEEMRTEIQAKADL